MMTENYLDKKFPDKIKDFHKYNEEYFSKLLDQKNLSINKNIHPIIAYNYPNLIEKFYNENDLTNINRSPSIMLHFHRTGLFIDKFSESDFGVCEIIKGINNKVYNSEELNEAIDMLFSSKRQKSTYSKAYPELHDKFKSVKDNFDYNMSLLAIEFKDTEYIKNNIGIIKKYFKESTKLTNPDVFYYLEPTDYSDLNLLRHIDRKDLVQFAKEDSTIVNFWNHNKTTEHSIVNNKYLLQIAIEMNLDIDCICYDFLNSNAEDVITHFPYFYSELNDDNKSNEVIKKLALRDPYNISEIGLTKENIKDFLNCSNINVLDAFDGIANSGNEKEYIEMLLNEINNFEGMFLALQTYPLLMLYLSDEKYYNHVTPYLINHACKIDKELFTFFREKESKR